jgi:hypothetical protein
MYCYISGSIDDVLCSSRSRRLSAVQKSELRTSIKLVFTTGKTSLYLLTRAHVIVIRLIAAVRGLFKGRELYGRLFL